jgi:hypothetical protein
MPCAWNGALGNPGAENAFSAMACAASAASAHGAQGRASCKRQVSGSNPLTGSQASEGMALSGTGHVDRSVDRLTPVAQSQS